MSMGQAYMYCLTESEIVPPLARSGSRAHPHAMPPDDGLFGQCDLRRSVFPGKRLVLNECLVLFERSIQFFCFLRDRSCSVSF